MASVPPDKSDDNMASALPEKIAFSGVEKHSIVSVSTYGCIQAKEDKIYFKAGLEAMMETLEPEVVLVYGPMPEFHQQYTNHHNHRCKLYNPFQYK